MGALLTSHEGQWPPGQLTELKLEEKGLKLKPEALWGGQDSLLQAVVNYSGCSAAFISERGLIATNHHCAYPAIQAQSSVERNYLKEGFLAKRKEDELRAQGRSTISVLLSIEDVTREVLAKAESLDDDRARHLALKGARAKIVAQCEKDNPAHRCRVASFNFGGRFELHRSLHLTDVRLVYAPPASIGEYGGEVDNWMWPRHTGDFTLLRAYVGKDGQPAEYHPDNVPFSPKRWLTISPDGVTAGDFVAVVGYPGHTDRYLPAVEIQRQVEQVLPGRVDLYGEWIRILDAAAQDPEAAIKSASKRRSLANRHKNAAGMIAGIKAMDLLKRRFKEDSQLALKPRNKRVLVGLAELSQERRERFPRDFLIENLPRGPDLLAVAVDFGPPSPGNSKT